jgi:hypothetical protein
MLLADVLLDGAVNLGQVDVLLREGFGSLLVLGGQRFAVAAPRSVDCGALETGDWGGRRTDLTFDEGQILLLDEVMERVLGELCDGGGHRDGKRQGKEL